MMKFNRDTLDVRVILKPYILPTKSEGGIDLSAISVRSQVINTDRGEIYMVGPNCWYERKVKPNVKPGDKVYYSKYGAKVLQDDETKELFIICNDEDLLCAYTEEKTKSP